MDQIRVAVMARAQLPQAAVANLVQSLGAMVVALADTSPEGHRAILRSGARVVVYCEGIPDLTVEPADQLGPLVALRVLVLCDAPRRSTWESVGVMTLAYSASVGELRAAIKALDDGPAHSGSGATVLPGAASQSPAVAGLSQMELSLLPLIASGLPLRDAARALAISYKTADNSRTRIFRKLGVRDRIQLARFAIREGIIPP
ncbi:MAG: response regulator transcription factor [Phycisphaerales bacterium]|nr:response regulator transcription factor [Phycisphaerales bacterium]